MIDRQEIKRAYKEKKAQIGIYKIENKVNGKIYIGSSLNIQARFNRHKMSLSTGIEEVKELLNDYRKYGEENFEFSIVDLIKQDDNEFRNYKKELKELEQMYLEELKPYGNKGYNILK
ncbi:MAG TPA: GIY-YIG nuclease family protein [Melioribacteraceae bacterium]|nr:GIY-YIG nuclease family protein [Melioribacteraceae bacterium]